MRHRKKLLAWVLLVCLCVCGVPIFAQEAYTEPTLCVQDASSCAGDIVQVQVVMHNNPGIVSMQLDVEYDPTVLTLIGVSDGGLIGSYAHSDQLSLCPYRLTWVNDLATRNYTANGTIVTLTFEVNSTAAAGEYAVIASYTKNNFEIFNCNAQEVDFNTVIGSVSVFETSSPVSPTTTGSGIAEGIAQQAAPAVGWTLGSNNFTVTSEKPCTVAVSYDGGATYTRLTAAVNSMGAAFAADITADTIIAVVVRGDVTGDGKLRNSDVIQLKAAALGKLTFEALDKLVGDVTGDGKLRNSDVIQLKAAALGKLSLPW